MNIISPEGTGDWHSFAVFCNEKNLNPKYKYRHIFGEGQPPHRNTNPYLGDRGIYDATDILHRMGYDPENTPVWAANHARAVVDCLYTAVLDNGITNSVILDEWFPAIEDKEKVYELIDILKPQLDERRRGVLEKWIQENPITE
ncbi:hypothetical protein [Basilea psittacipulmonis]|uniref:hypothetical protein n=1 Tax=Basilea psittacipulmonis TaxID=1472345 RepID=UPI00191BD06F|nr:hypothetical protein [Basilea psittacipulmonis]